MTKLISIYTDGSANNWTKSAGGYGIVVKDGDDLKMFSGGQFINTNSARMELMGALFGLKKCESGHNVHVYLDNQYVVNSFVNRWIFRWESENWRARKNADLLSDMLNEYRRLQEQVTFHWVRGHAGHDYNEMCDLLAKQGGQRKTIIKDNRYI